MAKLAKLVIRWLIKVMANKIKKILVIEHCEDCMFCIHDDQRHTERYGKYWCDNLDYETNASGIPAWCPLPNAQNNARVTQKEQ